MKKVKGMPITGTNIETSRKRPFVPNAKDTSGDAQTMIGEAPMPFKNKMETPQMPAPSGPKGAVPGLEPKVRAGLQRSSPGVKALPPGGPIGQRKMPNQSKQIGGRMGWPPPKRKAGSNAGGYPVKRNARFYGE